MDDIVGRIPGLPTADEVQHKLFQVAVGICLVGYNDIRCPELSWEVLGPPSRKFGIRKQLDTCLTYDHAVLFAVAYTARRFKMSVEQLLAAWNTVNGSDGPQ